MREKQELAASVLPTAATFAALASTCLKKIVKFSTLECGGNSVLARLETLRKYFKKHRDWMDSKTMSPLDGQKKDN
jgi:hypothetical protein